jgi:hypothetical protein
MKIFKILIIFKAASVLVLLLSLWCPRVKFSNLSLFDKSKHLTTDMIDGVLEKASIARQY